MDFYKNVKKKNCAHNIYFYSNESLFSFSFFFRKYTFCLKMTFFCRFTNIPHSRRGWVVGSGRTFLSYTVTVNRWNVIYLLSIGNEVQCFYVRLCHIRRYVRRMCLSDRKWLLTFRNNHFLSIPLLWGCRIRWDPEALFCQDRGIFLNWNSFTPPKKTFLIYQE